MSLFLMLVLHFTAAATGQSVSYFTVRVEDDVTLPCNNVIDGQNNCDRTTWLFTGSRSRSAVELVIHGQIHGHAKAKSDRLSVTEKCSLVIKNVTVEDVGRYICQQYEYRGAPKSSSDSEVDLSVVSMTEHRNADVVTLICSVLTHEPCRHTVKWLYEGKEVDTDNGGVTTSQSLCSAFVRALSFSYVYKSEFKSVQCSVTDGDKEQQLFPFRLQSSGKKPGEGIVTTTITTTTTTKPLPPTNDASTKQIDWRWLLIILAVVLVALSIIVVKVIRRKRAEESKSQMEDDVADAEDGVHYASVSYTKNTHSKAKVQGNSDDEEGGDVTYTIVKASSTDPSCLYATVK
ncbi:uncharacterized protein AB9X84_002770 isoform 1-T1 [Acanthopagrus schlegelii]